MASTETLTITPQSGTATLTIGSRVITVTMTSGAMVVTISVDDLGSVDVQVRPAGPEESAGFLTDSAMGLPAGTTIRVSDPRTAQQRAAA